MTDGERVSVKEHLETRLAETRQYLEARIEAVRESIEVAKVEQDRHMLTLNNFRQAMQDQSAQYVTRQEYGIQHTQSEAEIKTLVAAKDVAAGKASQGSVNVAMIMAILSMMGTALVALMNFLNK